MRAHYIHVLLAELFCFNMHELFHICLDFRKRLRTRHQNVHKNDDVSDEEDAHGEARRGTKQFICTFNIVHYVRPAIKAHHLKESIHGCTERPEHRRLPEGRGSVDIITDQTKGTDLVNSLVMTKRGNTPTQHDSGDQVQGHARRHQD